jgi:hypothetical protein
LSTLLVFSSGPCSLPLGQLVRRVLRELRVRPGKQVQPVLRVRQALWVRPESPVLQVLLVRREAPVRQDRPESQERKGIPVPPALQVALVLLALTAILATTVLLAARGRPEVQARLDQLGRWVRQVLRE